MNNNEWDKWQQLLLILLFQSFLFTSLAVLILCTCTHDAVIRFNHSVKSVVVSS